MRLRSYAYKYESEVLKVLSDEYEYCVRVHMSFMTFYILCIDRGKAEIAFIEVKYGKSDLTQNQRTFKSMIESVSNWRVMYRVYRVR